MIKTVLALENKFIPANLHLIKPNSQVNWQELPFKLPQEPISWNNTPQPRTAGISSFGFSGTNAHIVVREAKADLEIKREKDIKQDFYLFTLSARTQNALKDLVQRYLEYFHQGDPDFSKASLPDICFTANTGRSHFNYRLAAVVSSIDDLQSKLTQYAAQNTSSQLWQDKVNSNQESKLALRLETEDRELVELIESVVGECIVPWDLADVYWQIGNKPEVESHPPNLIYSEIKPELSNWQILVSGLAQLIYIRSEHQLGHFR